MAAAAGFDVDLAEAVVLVYDEALLPRSARRRRNHRGTHPFRSVARMSEAVDLVVASGPGSPVAAVTVEFLAALGARRIVSVGRAGLLRPPEARIHVVDRAVSDEGTSRHYSDDLTAAEDLTAALTAAVKGLPSVTLTTDVPFRHTQDRLRAHRSVAGLVEMECAATFSAARMFGIEAGALLVVSDVFGEHEWSSRPSAETDAALSDAVELAANVLTLLA